MQVQNNYQLLIQKLDRFIRKYYLNQVIRGSLYTVGFVLLLFLAASLTEYFLYLAPAGRKVLFYSFVLASLGSLAYWVITPLVHYFRLGTLISHEQAAAIIGNHFTSVQDKLLNVLQLNKQSSDLEHAALIQASINQKSEEIRPVPFVAAIDLSKNRKYLRYALPPLFMLLAILLAAPSIIRDSTDRLIHNDKHFERKAPFDFILQNSKLIVPQNESIELEVKVSGSLLPESMMIEYDNYQYKLTKKDKTTFTYTINNVQRNTPFHFNANGFSSKEFELEVLKKPALLDFEVKLDYPAYTGRKDEVLKNTGDLEIPAGTGITWVFQSQHTDQLEVFLLPAQKPLDANRLGDAVFSVRHTANNSGAYKIYVGNHELPRADSMNYNLAVIPDLHPSIAVERFIDSSNAKVAYFVGTASDDYGLRSLRFIYSILQGGKARVSKTLALPMQAGKEIKYEHILDINTLGLQPGEELQYYFEVFDNDAVHGSKSARTALMTFNKPTEAQYEKQTQQNNEAIKDKLEKAIAESKKIQEQYNALKNKLLQEKEMNWQAKKELEKLMERQQSLEEEIKKAKEQFEENLQNQQEFEKPSPEQEQKQEKIQELFEKLMDEENQKLMEKIQELMDKLKKDDALQMMDQQQLESENKEMELDRMLELFKKLELENEMNKQAEKLDELSKKEEDLSKDTEQQKQSTEDLKKEQDKLNKEFDQLQQNMKEIEKKNEELEKPQNLEDQKEQMEDIEKDMENASKQLQDKQNKSASQAQKNASKKMKKLSEKMSADMQAGAMEQMQEDVKAMRQLLENLVQMSFEQEALMKRVEQVTINTPAYTTVTQQQFKLQDDFGMIKDSLHALSKRVFQIESYVTERVTTIDDQLKKSISNLEDRVKPEASKNQQRVMKEVNDLALMLAESMDQMQQQMSSSMPGNQMCSKPGKSGKGKGQVPMDKITEGQQKLNEEMKKMAEGRQKGGQKPQGQGKDGKPSQGGEGGSEAKEFAQMAAKQAALRKALKDLQKEAQQQGQGNKNLQEIIDAMDKVETDLVNKRLTNEMMKRQQDIMTRLLEAERASREREYDEQRKSETAGNPKRTFPPALQDYIRKKEAEVDQYKTVSPALRPYYKNLVEGYYNALKANPGTK